MTISPLKTAFISTLAVLGGVNAQSSPLQADCPSDQLSTILGNEYSTAAKAMQVFDDTQGILCYNYLPWKDEYYSRGTGYIDGINIKTDDLSKPAMWGIDPRSKHPFIAARYTINNTELEGAVTFFQRRYTSYDDYIVGGHYQIPCAEKYVGQLAPKNPDFTKTLYSFLSHRVVEVKSWLCDINKYTQTTDSLQLSGK